MGRRIPKITAEAYGKVWKFDAEQYCGYIKCDRLQKVFPISIDAWSNDNSWLCSCGNWTDKDNWYHVVFYKGKELKYEN